MLLGAGAADAAELCSWLVKVARGCCGGAALLRQGGGHMSDAAPMAAPASRRYATSSWPWAKRWRRGTKMADLSRDEAE